jgi:hypothetical protein
MVTLNVWFKIEDSYLIKENTKKSKRANNSKELLKSTGD